jgi:asparagine N-glycosylation enzyme membrane subunit Stt3
MWWALAFFVATLVQWRFMNSYSIAHCLLIGIMLKSLQLSLAPHLTNRRRVWGAAVLAILGIWFAFSPALRSYGLHFNNVGRSLRGQETPPVGTFLQASLVTGAARFLRDHSPREEQASYSVLGPWGDGHILKYVAERAVVQDNFGDDVAPLNFRRAEQYFAAVSESQALEILSPMDTRYVLVRSTGSGQSRSYSLDSQFTRLFRLKGSLGRPTERAGRHDSVVDALQRHRLVYQSASLREGGRIPFCMLFEIVAGAELVGRADPSAVIIISLSVEPRLGSRFEYRARIRANAAGEYRLRLPYSNESFSTNVRTADHYTLRVGERSAVVMIPESAVLDGTRVDGPTLGS